MIQNYDGKNLSRLRKTPTGFHSNPIPTQIDEQTNGKCISVLISIKLCTVGQNISTLLLGSKLSLTNHERDLKVVINSLIMLTNMIMLIQAAAQKANLMFRVTRKVIKNKCPILANFLAPAQPFQQGRHCIL